MTPLVRALQHLLYEHIKAINFSTRAQVRYYWQSCAHAGEKAVEYIVNHSESSVIFVNTKKWPELVASIAQLKTVHTVIYWGSDAINPKVRPK